MLWTNAANAMGAGQPAGGGANPLTSFVPLILMFAIFYFLLIRPQQKKAKEHKAMLGAIKKGDNVVTAGGIHGRVADVLDDVLVLDLGETKIRVGRSFVSAVIDHRAKKDDKKPADKKAARDADRKEDRKDGKDGQDGQQ